MEQSASLGERIHDVGVIYTEVEFFEIYADSRFWRLWWYLRRKGFVLHGFPWLWGYFGDVVFVNRDRLTGKRFQAQIAELRALGSDGALPGAGPAAPPSIVRGRPHHRPALLHQRTLGSATFRGRSFGLRLMPKPSPRDGAPNGGGAPLC